MGRKLVDTFFDTVILKGCKKVYLITKSMNRDLIAFYKNLEFIEDKSQETIDILGTTAVKNYTGIGEHMVIFYELIE